ncbi:TPA: tyrosine--tRNA ligase [Vibrio vulnificus]|nr:tyrosine--tRNA ligase [Vibrio vulnificus]
MNSQLLFDDLAQRGLIAQTTDLEQLIALFCQPQTLYCGFDPTAGSLHIGHLVPLMMLKRFQDAGHQGISFTEFSYSLLQSYDFAQLNQTHQCALQIGGNDQWGNIVSGIDLTRRLNGTTVHGLTLPLITKSDGTKFGKTESGAIWLDAAKTSPYMFYQFWLNSDDADVYRFLRYYTFLSVEQIEHIETSDKAQVGKPSAQRILAEEMTRFVHGQAGLESAQRISEALFSGQLNQLNLAELQQLEQDGLPCTLLTHVSDVITLLLETGLASSKRQAREWLENGAIRINGERWHEQTLAQTFALYDQYYIVQRGKKQFAMVKLTQR